jgi:uncharacterized MAPEG superfamily protein
MSAMTPRQLLMTLTAMARMANAVNLEHGPRWAKHGERGLKRRARKARRNAHAVRLQRVSWCRYAEDVKRAEALIAKGRPC